MRLLLSIVILFMLTVPAFGMSSYEDVKASYQRSDALLLDRHGEEIHELRVDPNARKLEWARLADISPALVTAVIRSEDKRFYDHHGVDWKALSSAAISNLWSHNRRGASTISMQLASLLDAKLKPKKGQRSLGQKWDQIKAGREIEKTWTKEQILEAYLNLVSFRGELQGISTASRGIFDKEPAGLDDAESVVLAALIRSPNADPKKVGERAALLAASLGYSIGQADIKDLVNACLARPYVVRKRIDLAPHVAKRLLHEGSTKIVSTLDARLQRFAVEALQQAVGALSDQNVSDGAVLVVDNKSGDVLAYVGNSGGSSPARYVDGILARRQAGSTLKPFLYGLAIENRILTSASLIEDAPLDLPTGRGLYRPENYDKTYRGMVTARTALASSLNIPAVRTIELVGTDAFLEKLQDFGFTGLREAEDYGPSLALGTADISLWELVNAYRTLANTGTWSGLKLTPSERTTSRRRALSREAAFIISSILSDREARSATFTLENPLATRYWTAVKTGTSKDMRDNWCVGYSDHYTVGVWVGNFSGAAMWNVSGVSGAAPVWLEVMNYLHARVPSRTPSAPGGVTAQMVRFNDDGRLYDKKEWFLAGTEQKTVRPRTAEQRPKIIYPAADTVIAVDPDIPQDMQRVFFESSSGDPALRIVLDEIVIGAAPAASWQPIPGRHGLSLVGPDGVVADSISFEVR
ncbi:MAG TPA: penicillin-binding protein 1C [Nitrospirota bacterium]|nr:penicillin-binding protein 1C [Nitrospirota bacterium]